MNLGFPSLLIVFLLFRICHAQAQASLPIGIPHAGQPKIKKTQGSSEYANIHCGLQDKSGNLWFGSTGEGVYRYDGKSFINYTVKDGLNDNNVWSIFEDSLGNILFGTNKGICRYDARQNDSVGLGKSFARFTRNDTLNTYSVWCFLEDKKGNLWFGTDANGIYWYDGKSFNRLLSQDISNKKALRLNVIQEMIEDSTGDIWFASWNTEGVARYNGKELINYSYNQGLDDGMIHSILQDKHGNIWAGSRNHGVYRYDGKSFVNFTEKEGLSRSCIYSMVEDKAGNIWFATDKEGVWRYDGKSFTNFTTKDGLNNNSVFCIVEDTSGNLWFGTRDVGLCRYDGRTFTTFSE